MTKRAHQGLVWVTKPAPEAVEFVSLMGWETKVDWSALRKSIGQFKDYFRLADIKDEVEAGLRECGPLSGAELKAKRQELRNAARERKRGEWSRQRGYAAHLYKLVKLYQRHRDRILALPKAKQPAAVRELEAAYMSGDGAAMAKLEGRAAEYAAKQKTAFEIKRWRQFVGMITKEAGIKRAPRRPYKRMQFPKSAADPFKAFDGVYEEAKSAWRGALEVMPELRDMPAKEAAKFALHGTKLIRADEEMWHSRKAVPTASDYEPDKYNDN